ncbi:Stk1 family PASTA domain-containing Ser/Thr kinase [Butyrivibrio hungatei]|uniref:Stk1 family PASTA domain-containing Ser/Thr kinase n=1 Tax=Butyrivibrio hungatei TaxID=185008 RepID=UPI0003FD094D|nr:Stk1 family PASTA domain-containing Ser/Thr kinase [Butyrivibrio hungatei]
MIKIGMVIGDRYEVLEKIGTGGMSDVYKAKDHKLNRLVAVKILKQEFSENENFVAKFRVEAQSTAGLMHPNIVNVYDVGDEDGINYIVMELVDGITLKKYIEKKVRLSVKEAVSIAIQVAMGLEAAHNNNIIHRDIKPQNIMISKDGKVKVTDFGIAKAATSNTITSNVMGSVHYTSPEQARGGYSDAKSDIYSLGITLFEMLTGRVPFNGDTTVAIAIKHIQEELPTPTDFNEEIPISVEKIVLKCCQKSPDRRYQNAAELIQDLKKSLITPDKDFVSMVDPDEDGVTRVASDEEVRHVKNRDPRMPEPEQMRLKRDVVREYEQDDYDDYDREIRKYGRDYEDDDADEEEEDYYYREEHDRRRRGTMQEDGKIERITSSIAIVMAVIVALVVVLLVARGIGLFGTIDSNEGSSGASDAKVTAEDSDKGKVPDVVGKTYAEAKSLLEDDRGYKVKKEADKDNTQPNNTVVSTSPAAGEKLDKGSTITVYVSNGSKYKGKADASSDASSMEGEIEVPDLVGLETDEAMAVLVEAGLELGTAKDVKNSDPKLMDKVCRQIPEAGKKVKEGTVVHIEVSTGPGEISYSFKESLPAPEGGKYPYNPGDKVHITITSSEGTVLREFDTTSFPYPVEIAGIKTPTGVVSYTYYVSVPAAEPDAGFVPERVDVQLRAQFTQETH